MESKKRAWLLLQKLSEADEERAFNALRDSREKHAASVRQQRRLLVMRQDYENRLTHTKGLVQGAHEIEATHNFILHIDGLQKLMQQQIHALAQVVGQAECAYEKVRLNTSKWSLLGEREAALQCEQRTVAEQKEIDEGAALRFVRRVGRV